MANEEIDQLLGSTAPEPRFMQPGPEDAHVGVDPRQPEVLPELPEADLDVVLPDDDEEREETVHHPRHYNEHPSGVECIEIVEHYNFNIGNAIKYLWRAGLKGDEEEDLRKAAWYVNREVERRDQMRGRA